MIACVDPTLVTPQPRTSECGDQQGMTEPLAGFLCTRVGGRRHGAAEAIGASGGELTHGGGVGDSLLRLRADPWLTRYSLATARGAGGPSFQGMSVRTRRRRSPGT